jgi:citronellol/citronellal dehydrogenase
MPYQSVFRPDLFKGRTIIVTGGGSGIGRCTAHELVALGADVAILGRTAEKLAEVKAEIEEDGGRVLTQVCDIRDETMVIAAIDARSGLTAASTGL